jgi:hypothetical protein
VVTERARVLTHPRSTLVVGIVCIGLFIALAILSGIFAKPEQGSTSYFFLLFVLLGVPIVAEGLRVRHELHDEGIAYRGLLFQHALVPWNELESARWSHSMKWLAVTTRDERVLRFSGLLNGLDALALALNEKVRGLRVDKATTEILAHAREGKLPSVWG